MGATPAIVKMFPGFYLTGPTVWWLGISSGKPAVNGGLWTVRLFGKNVELTFEEHDNPLKAFLYVLSWAVIIALQLLFVFAFVAWCLLSLVYLLPLSVLGLFWFNTKALSIGPIWNLYFTLWSGPSSEFAQRKIDVDTGVLNLALMAHLLNTGPQFLVQIFNNSYTNLWTPVAYFSTWCVSRSLLLSHPLSLSFFLYVRRVARN